MSAPIDPLSPLIDYMRHAPRPIRYAWVDQDGAQCHGEIDVEPATAYDAADKALRGIDDEGRYFATETGEWMHCTREEYESLGAALLAGIPMSQAYSIWCVS